MGNVTLPTPVAVAGGALCLLGGYLLGIVAGPSAPSRTTAEVESYDVGDGLLCLVGEDLTDQEGVEESGRLCGTWRRSAGDQDLPDPGERFRFISVVVDQPPEGEEGSNDDSVTMIYGNVLP